MSFSFSVGELLAIFRLQGESQFNAGVQRSQDVMVGAAGTAEELGGAVRQSQVAFEGAGRSAGIAANGSAKLRAAQLSAIAAQERYNALLADGDASVARLASAEASLIRANERVAASTPTSAIERQNMAMRATPAAVEQSRNAFGEMIKMAGQLGLVLGGLAIAHKALEFVMAGKDLTTALNGVQAASHATDAEMARVRAQAIGLGQDLTVPRATAVDAAAAIQDLVKAGVALPKAMTEARYALLLASAAQVDTADSARILGDVMDDFRLPAEQAARVANYLAAGANSAGGGLMDMFDAMKYVGPRARAVGVDVKDVVVALTFLAKSGLQGSLAGTGLAMSLQRLAAPTKMSRAALADLGVTAWDAQGRFVGLPSLIDQLHSAMGRMGNDKERFLKDISNAFGARAANTIAVFASGGIEHWDKFEQAIGSGNVQKYADQMNRGFGAAMGQIDKQLTAAGIAVYQKLEPALADSAMWLGTSLPHAVGVLVDILAPTTHLVGDELTGAWHGVEAVLGPVSSGLGTVAHFLEEERAVVSPLISTVLSMWVAWKAYGIAVTATNAIRDSVAGMSGRLTSGAGAVSTWGAAWRGQLTGVSTQAGLTSAMVEADLAAMGAAAATEAAEIDTAAASQAEAYASIVLASEDASASQIAAAVNAAAAATAQAEASQAAAVATVAAADVAAAGVEEASAVAALSWSAMLGPLALIGVGVAAMTMAFGNNGSAAADNAAEIQSLTQAIKDDNGALGENTRQTVINALQKAGALAAARELGISLSDVTDAALGNADAYRAVTYQARIYTIGSLNNTASTRGQTVAAHKLLDALTGQSGAVKSATQAAKDQTAANRTSATSTQRVATAAKQAAAAHQLLATNTNLVVGADGNLMHSTMTVAKASDAAGKALQAQTIASQNLKLAEDLLNGVNESVETSTDSLAIALGNLRSGQALATDAAGHQSRSLDQNTVAGATNRQMLVGLIDAAKAQAQATADQAAKHTSLGRALQIGNGQLKTNEDAIRAAAKAAGLDKQDVDHLIGSLGILSKVKAVPTIDANTVPASSKATAIQARINAIRQGRIPGINVSTYAGQEELRGLQQQIDNMRGTTVTIQMVEQLRNTYNDQVPKQGRATGGLIVGPGTGTSDTAGAYRLSNREFVSTALSVSRNLWALQAANQGATLTIADAARSAVSRSAGAMVPVATSMSSSGSAAPLDLRPLTARLDAIERHLAAAADAPERFAAAAVDGYRDAGKEQGRQLVRAGRKTGRQF